MTLGVPLLCFVLFLAFSSIAMFAPQPAPAPPVTVARPPAVEPAWPARIDARARVSDPSARVALAQALGACRGAWAHDLLLEALAEEAEPPVHAALVQALAEHDRA